MKILKECDIPKEAIIDIGTVLQAIAIKYELELVDFSNGTVISQPVSDITNSSGKPPILYSFGFKRK